MAIINTTRSGSRKTATARNKFAAAGKLIAEARKAKGMTQKEVGRALDLSESYMSVVEMGRLLPSCEKFAHICALLEMSADPILEEVRRAAPLATPLNTGDADAAQNLGDSWFFPWSLIAPVQEWMWSGTIMVLLYATGEDGSPSHTFSPPRAPRSAPTRPGRSCL